MWGRKTKTVRGRRTASGRKTIEGLLRELASDNQAEIERWRSLAGVLREYGLALGIDLDQEISDASNNDC